MIENSLYLLFDKLYWNVLNMYQYLYVIGNRLLLIKTAIKLLTLKQVKEIEKHIIKYLIENK